MDVARCEGCSHRSFRHGQTDACVSSFQGATIIATIATHNHLSSNEEKVSRFYKFFRTIICTNKKYWLTQDLSCIQSNEFSVRAASVQRFCLFAQWHRGACDHESGSVQRFSRHKQMHNSVPHSKAKPLKKCKT